MAGSMRIGELLVRDGIVTPEQLEQGLEAQVIHGGRIGTNLVEHVRIDLDLIAAALGVQRGMPAAMARHFEEADPELQHKLPGSIASRMRVVPIGYVGERIGVACCDPLTEDQVRDLGTVLGGPVFGMVATELRIWYQIELVYGIPRPTRMLRVPTSRPDVPIVPPPPPLPPAEGAEDDLSVDVSFDSSTHHPTVNRPAPPRRANKERRGYLRTLSDSEPARKLDTGEPGEGSLGRIALRRVAVDGGTYSGERVIPSDGSNLSDVLRSIRRAHDRDRVADLVVSGMREGVNQILDAGIIFIIREAVAVGWKGFVRDAPAASLEGIALPLEAPSLLRDVCESRDPLWGLPPDGGKDLDMRLWERLGCAFPSSVAVLPMEMGEHIVGVLYAQAENEGAIDAGTGAVLGELVNGMMSAFRRLIRAAQR